MRNLAVAAILIFVAVLFRFAPHPMNFTPVLAMALLSGRWFKSSWGLAVPLLAMVLSDAVLGFSEISAFVYLSMSAAFVIGWVFNRGSYGSLTLQAFLSSVLFFVISNAGVWWTSGMYSLSFQGLINSYVAAIPFFHNTLLSTVMFALGLQFLKTKIAFRVSREVTKAA